MGDGFGVGDQCLCCLHPVQYRALAAGFLSGPLSGKASCRSLSEQGFFRALVFIGGCLVDYAAVPGDDAEPFPWLKRLWPVSRRAGYSSRMLI